MGCPAAGNGRVPLSSLAEPRRLGFDLDNTHRHREGLLDAVRSGAIFPREHGELGELIERDDRVVPDADVIADALTRACLLYTSRCV